MEPADSGNSYRCAVLLTGLVVEKMRIVLVVILLALFSVPTSIAASETTIQIFKAGPSDVTFSIKEDGHIEFKRRNKKTSLNINAAEAKKLISLSRELVAAVYPLALESAIKRSPQKRKNMYLNYNVTVSDEHSYIGVSFDRETEEYSLLARELKRTLSGKVKTRFWRRVK